MVVGGCLVFLQSLLKKSSVSFTANDESHLTEQYMVTKLPAGEVQPVKETAVEISPDSVGDWESDDKIDSLPERTVSPGAADYVA